MIARRRTAKGALASVIGAILFLGILLILQGAFSIADTPWPWRSPEQDPYKYEEYCSSDQLPGDYSKTDDKYWEYTSEKSDSLYHSLISTLNPDLCEKELEGIMGCSVDKAWSITTGRPDVLIAELGSGIRWQDVEAMNELAGKCYLNAGEIPPPLGADSWDKNGDGIFNVDDFTGDPRVSDLNGNGLLDPEDLIWRFADGEDDDANGYIDDISGWDFLEDDNDAWDECDYGRSTDECGRSASEAANGSGMPGTCPNAMLLVVRIGDSSSIDANDFAQGVIFAVDTGAWVVQESLDAFNNSPLAQEAVDYAYANGVAVITAATGGESAHQDYPANYEHTIQASAVQKYKGTDYFLLDQFPPSYLYLGGSAGYGAHAIVSAPFDGEPSGITGGLAGIAGLLYSAAENEVRRGEMWRYPGLDKPLSACEVKQIIAMTADDINFSPGSYSITSGPLDPVIGPSQRFPSDQGWDQYSGYGRINAYEAVKAVDEGRIPPEAEIRSPGWFELLNPGQVSLEVVGRVAAVRADSYQYTVEWGPGLDPSSDEWITVGSQNSLFESYEGVLAELDLGEIYQAVMNTMEARGGKSDPNRYAFSVRVRVRDNQGNWGEDRRTMFCYDDPDAYAGTPFNVASDISASPRFADLDADGTDELIVATGEGLIHAYNADFSEVEGWPVSATPLPLHTDSAAFKVGMVTETAYASVQGTPAVGDLDHDGTLEVIAGDSEGRMYAWDNHGNLLQGFPVRSNPLYSIPDRADWWTEGVLPAEWFNARFVPDKIHHLDKWNRLDKAFPRGPVLCNLDGSMDGSLEIIATCMDGHIYAWHGDGAQVRGWPVKLVDAQKVASFDAVTHTCEFKDKESIPAAGHIVANPSVADLDGDGDLEVICGTGEFYAGEPLNVSSQTFGLASLLPMIEPLIASVDGTLYRPGNARVYALYCDGSAHGLEADTQPQADTPPSQAYLEGWPASIATVAPGAPESLAGGIGGPVAVADIDKDGNMEIAAAAAGGPGVLLEADGTSFLGNDADGLPLSLQYDEAGTASQCVDAPFMSIPGAGCFASLGSYGLSYIAPTMGFGRMLDLILPADQTKASDGLSAWRAADGLMLPTFPFKMNDMMLSATPGAADVDGDGSQEVLAASSYYDFHAVNANGVEPAGWPKFTGGWSVTAPCVGDFDGDGGREIVMGTREGWLLTWKTSSTTADMADWPQYGHDLWGTGWLEADAIRPGRVFDLAVEKTLDEEGKTGIKLTWTAPGDDGYQGQAMVYDIRYLDRPIDASNWNEAIPLQDFKPMPASAGTAEELLVNGFPFDNAQEGTTYCFALQTRDEVGNLSTLSICAVISY